MDREYDKREPNFVIYGDQEKTELEKENAVSSEPGFDTYKPSGLQEEVATESTSMEQALVVSTEEGAEADISQAVGASTENDASQAATVPAEAEWKTTSEPSLSTANPQAGNTVQNMNSNTGYGSYQYGTNNGYNRSTVNPGPGVNPNQNPNCNTNYNANQNAAGNGIHHVGNGSYYQSYQTGQNPAPKKPVKQQRKKSGGKSPIWKRAVAFAAAGLIFGVAAGGAFQGVNMITNYFKPSAQNELTDNSSGENASNDTAGEIRTSQTSNSATVVTDVTDVVNATMPSLVAVTNISVQQVRDFFGRSADYESESSGSGIIVGQNETELLIATNYHVIKDADTLSVCFIDEEVAEAKVKGSDSTNDLAVIAVQLSDIGEATSNNIKIAAMGDSESLQVGEPAIAIGNALGYGQSVTQGVVSALNVTIDELEGTYIQTDAAINPGNSGGALLNVNGEVIGINAAKISSDTIEGMGYAIPITNATPILDELMNLETRDKVDESEKAFLGIAAGADVTSEISAAYGMPVGVQVNQALDGGAAQAAGIRKGDIITKFDKTDIDSMTKLQSTLEYYKAGEEVVVTIQRIGNDGEYQEMEIEVTLGEKTEE